MALLRSGTHRMTTLTGLRVLIVEDESGVALLLEDMLEDMGCAVVGTVARLAQAFEAAAEKNFDLTLLDVSLHGEESFPFARSLQEQGTPFVFSTGYGAVAIPADLKDHPVLAKPFTLEHLRAAVESASASSGSKATSTSA